MASPRSAQIRARLEHKKRIAPLFDPSISLATQRAELDKSGKRAPPLHRAEHGRCAGAPRETARPVSLVDAAGEAELAQVAAHLNQDAVTTRTQLSNLIVRGFVQEREGEDEGLLHYRVRMRARRGRLVSGELRQSLGSEIAES